MVDWSPPHPQPNFPSMPDVARPNIILIISDDMGYADVPGFGQNKEIPLPALERLQHEGAILTNAYVSAPICVPSRMGMFTGRHQARWGVYTNVYRGEAYEAWQQQKVIGQFFKEAGYQTALIGKWHLNSKPADEYDHHDILVGAGKQGFYYNPDFYSPEKGVYQEMGYSTDLVTEKSIAWLEKQVEQEQPFCLLVQFKAPHVPRMPPLRLLEKYRSDTIPEPETLHDDLSTRSYYAKQVNFFLDNFRPLPPFADHDSSTNIYWERMTRAERKAFHEAIDPLNAAYEQMEAAGLLDDSVKRRSYVYQRFIKDYLRIVDAVDENMGKLLGWLDAHEDIKQHTIVIYTSDQSYFTGEHGYAEKRLMYEPALHMPLLIRWPEKIQPGTRITDLVQNIDYAPTLLSAAGIPIPESMQG